MYVYILYIHIHTYIYIYMYVCMIFTTEGSLEVAIESWPEWDLNARLYILKKLMSLILVNLDKNTNAKM